LSVGGRWANHGLLGKGRGDQLEAHAEPSSGGITPGRSALILLGLVLLGLALRAVEIGREPLWSDESLTAILVR